MSHDDTPSQESEPPIASAGGSADTLEIRRVLPWFRLHPSHYKYLWASVGAIVAFGATILTPIIQDAVVALIESRGLHIQDVWFPHSREGANKWFTSPPTVAELLKYTDIDVLTTEVPDEYAPPWIDMCARASSHVYIAQRALSIRSRLQKIKKTIKDIQDPNLDLEATWLFTALTDDPSEGRDPEITEPDTEYIQSAVHVLSKFDFEHPEYEVFPRWRIALENRQPAPLYLRRIRLEILDTFPLYQGGGDDEGFSAKILKPASVAVFDLSQQSGGVVEGFLTDPILLSAQGTALLDVSIQKSRPSGSSTLYLVRVLIPANGKSTTPSAPFCFEMP